MIPFGEPHKADPRHKGLTMNRHHLPYFLRQYIEHKNPQNLRLHLVSNGVGWLALMTLFSQVHLPIGIPVLGDNLGALFTVVSVLYWLPVDLLVPTLVLGLTTLGVHIPGIPWGPMSPPDGAAGHGWIEGIVLPLVVFTACGLSALFAHIYYHEHCEFMKNDPPARASLELTHAVIWGPFHFWLQGLLARGYRPTLKAFLDGEERRAILRRHAVPWQCWGQTASGAPAVVCVPQNTRDVVDVVCEAAAAGKRVRVVGSGFTWSAFSATDDYLLFSERLDHIEIDRTDAENPAVWVGAGATNRQVNAVLAREGFTLPYNVVLETVRLAGVVSVGTHGSGRFTATMSDLVLALEVVTAQGEVRILSAQTLGEEGMCAARMGFGLFGVITRVRVAIVPAFQVLQSDRLCDEREVLEQLPRMVHTHDSVELYWLPYTDRIWVRTLDRTHQPARPLGLAFLTSNFLQMFLFIGVIRKVAPHLPWIARPMLRFGIHFLVFRDRILSQADAQHYRRWVEMARVRCVEVAFKVSPNLAEAKQAWLDTRRITREYEQRQIYGLNTAVNMRFIGPSDALLSPAFGPGLTCYIEALSVQGTPHWMDISRDLAQAWMSIEGALPHWAKELDQIPELEDITSKRLGTRLTRFHAALHASGVDPEGVFANPLTKKLGFSRV